MYSLPWHKRFFSSTRGRIIHLLRTSTRTVSELSAELELTDNAVRTHLSTLERDGLVQQSGIRRGNRKPHLSYDLTPEAEDLFPKAYEPLLQLLLGVLEERLEPEQADAVWEEVAQRIAGTQFRQLESCSFEERIAMIQEVIKGLGGIIELRENERGRYLESEGCPLSSVVRGHPRICKVMERVVSLLLGVPVRECCDRGMKPRCCFKIFSPGNA